MEGLAIHPNSENIDDFQYLIDGFPCIARYERFCCRIHSLFCHDKNSNYFGNGNVHYIHSHLFIIYVTPDVLWIEVHALHSSFFDSGPREFFLAISILIPVIGIGIYPDFLFGSKLFSLIILLDSFHKKMKDKKKVLIHLAFVRTI